MAQSTSTMWAAFLSRQPMNSTLEEWTILIRFTLQTQNSFRVSSYRDRIRRKMRLPKRFLKGLIQKTRSVAGQGRELWLLTLTIPQLTHLLKANRITPKRLIFLSRVSVQKSSDKAQGTNTLTPFQSIQEDIWLEEPTMARFISGKSTLLASGRGNRNPVFTGSTHLNFTRRQLTI